MVLIEEILEKITIILKLLQHIFYPINIDNIIFLVFSLFYPNLLLKY